MNALEVINLEKSYRKNFKSTHVLKELNFTIPQGKITGFIGANGAGKTTSLKCILDFCTFQKGEIKYFGKSGFTKEIKSRIGFLPERPYFYEFLSGREILQFYASLSGMKNQKDINARIESLFKTMDLSFAIDRALSSYSKGMLQKVGVAQALIHRPELVILDEPMSGLDPDGRHAISQLIQEIAKDGTAVFFSSHLLYDAEKLCDRLVLINGGRTEFEGNVKELLASSGKSSLEEVFVTMHKERLK
jgi:ABC-2 type transport system ATP-binding protein